MKNKKEKLPGYPFYPAKEDIYNKEDKQIQEENNIDDSLEDGPLTDALMGGDLDVPGGKLDDANELIGEEDEENNYYSLGGDEHNNLDENDS